MRFIRRDESPQAPVREVAVAVPTVAFEVLDGDLHCRIDWPQQAELENMAVALKLLQQGGFVDLVNSAVVAAGARSGDEGRAASVTQYLKNSLKRHGNPDARPIGPRNVFRNLARIAQ